MSKMQVSSIKTYMEKQLTHVKSSDKIENAIMAMPVNNINLKIKNSKQKLNQTTDFKDKAM